MGTTVLSICGTGEGHFWFTSRVGMKTLVKLKRYFEGWRIVGHAFRLMWVIRFFQSVVAIICLSVQALLQNPTTQQVKRLDHSVSMLPFWGAGN